MRQELQSLNQAAQELDSADPLAEVRKEFIGSETPLSYLDGNSLGRPLRRTAEDINAFIHHSWGGRLIRGWDEQWLELPQVIGDQLGSVALGAAPGQTVIADSTTVILYKLVRAAVAATQNHGAGGAPSRTELVVDTDNFPTDRYVMEGIAEELGMTLRWIQADPLSGVSLEQVQAVVGASTAVVLLSHVSYRSGYIADMAAITAAVHDAGALVVWDLCHSVGVLELALDECGVDFAAGCTYKYLNGGPGSPAFAYVNQRHLATLKQPIWGWMGRRDAFEMAPGYQAADGIRSFLSGTPPVFGMLAVRGTLEILAQVGMPAVRAKAIELTEFALRCSEQLLAPLGVTVGTPGDPAQRGGHITISHQEFRGMLGGLWEVDVIPDFRAPDALRIGLSPLSTSFAEVLRGMVEIRDRLHLLTSTTSGPTL
ncbi:kynureninase [Pseudarthrobacter sp. J1763]|uniref:kynureninase n=1 Tax=Pseudarthrobacter sp. J1763 TaxID=3420445 RepID=UPI003D2DBEC5